MGAKQDNSALAAKVGLRVRWVEGLGVERVRVLDCFGGRGVVWREVGLRAGVTVDRVGIERDRGKAARSDLVGDNMSYLPVLDLGGFDAVDVDAYGWPVRQLRVVAERAPGSVAVFSTRGRMALGGVPRAVLSAAGVPSGWGDAPQGLWMAQAGDLWDAYLVSLGFVASDRIVSRSSAGMEMVYERSTGLR